MVPGRCVAPFTTCLKNHPHVETFSQAPPDKGGAGATNVELKLRKSGQLAADGRGIKTRIRKKKFGRRRTQKIADKFISGATLGP